MSVSAEQQIDVINEVFGSHPGYRALHANGVLYKGSFTASPDAAQLTRAAHMQGAVIPATFRFSNGSGNPHHPDRTSDARGMAVKMYLPDGSRTDIVAITSPLFPTRKPEGFGELLKIQSSPLTAPLRLPLFLARYPEAARALPVIAPTLRPPQSYALIPYYGVHAFRWLDAEGGERHVRYKLVPETTAPRLLPWQARRRERDYLRQDIAERVRRGTVRFTLELQVAAPGDPIDDPSARWPDDRRRVNAGTLEVTGPETERETGGDVLVFDPTRVTDGIELTNDPVLHFRRDSYSVSVARRTQGQ
jgi:catalase